MCPWGGGEFTVQVQDLAIDLGRNRRLCQAFADALGHLPRPGAVGDLFAGAIGKSKGNHVIVRRRLRVLFPDATPETMSFDEAMMRKLAYLAA